jgi:hypothetical protein
MNTNYKGLNKHDNPDQPMQVEIKNKVLSISIGVSTLAFAAENGDVTPATPNHRLQVLNNDSFALDVKTELESEWNGQPSLVHKLFDAAITLACDRGSFFVKERKET